MRLFQIFALLLLSISAAQAIEWQEVEVPKMYQVNCRAEKGDDILLGKMGIRVSHDGGQTFTYSNKLVNVKIDSIEVQNNSFPIRALHITDAGNYIAVTSKTSILYSTNKGESWLESEAYIDITKQYKVTGDYFDDFAEIIETDNGLFLFYDYGAFISKDDGLNWIRVQDLYVDGDVRYVSKINEDYIYVLPHYSDSDDKYLYVLNCKTQTTEKHAMDLFLTKFCTYQGRTFGYYTYPWGKNAIEYLWETTDNGKTWSPVINLQEGIHSSLQPEAKELTIHSIEVANGMILCYYYATRQDNYSDYAYALSTDNGTSWRSIGFGDLKIKQYAGINLIDSNLVIQNLYGYYKYDYINDKVEETGADFTLTYALKKAHDTEYAIHLLEGYTNVYSTKTYVGWIPVSLIHYGYDFYISKHSEVFTSSFGCLIREYDGGSDTASKRSMNSVVRDYDDGSLLVSFDVKNTSSTKDYLLLDQGKKDTIIEAVGMHADYDKNSGNYYYVTNFPESLARIYTGNKNHGLIDSVDFPLNKNIRSIGSFSRQANKLMFEVYDNKLNVYKYYTSTDGGKNFHSFSIPKIFRFVKPMVHKKWFFYANDFGLFRSEDGITWENLLEEKFEGNVGVLNYEFDLEGHIIAYTTMGTFKSEAPVSVQEDENNTNTPNISINIYPNPSSDVLNFDFNGQVDNAQVIDLNGNTISCPQTLNSLDISKLSSGAYFLKVTSNGKTFYRQFVKAE